MSKKQVLSALLVALGIIVFGLCVMWSIHSDKINELEEVNLALAASNAELTAKLTAAEGANLNQEKHIETLNATIEMQERKNIYAKIFMASAMSLLQKIENERKKTQNFCDGMFVPVILAALKEFTKLKSQVKEWIGK